MPGAFNVGTICYFCKGHLKEGKRVAMIVGQALISEGVITGNTGDAAHKWRIQCVLHKLRNRKGKI